jgi:hypothetical protein
MNKKRIKRILEKTFNVKISRKLIPEEPKSLYINEAVNFEKETIFIAIPKTGTTTIRTQLKQPGIPIIWNPHLNINQVRDLIYIYLLKENLGKNRTFPDGNIPADNELRQKAEKIFDAYFKFSAVRNPWARAVSLYSRREGIILKNNMTFDEFCENHIYASDTCHHPTLHKNQLDWLTSNEGQILMDYIYKVEEFDKAIDEIRELTNGRLILDRVKQNVNPESGSGHYKNIYNDKTRKLIAKRFEKDIDYFKYTF